MQFFQLLSFLPPCHTLRRAWPLKGMAVPTLLSPNRVHVYGLREHLLWNVMVLTKDGSVILVNGCVQVQPADSIPSIHMRVAGGGGGSPDLGSQTESY